MVTHESSKIRIGVIGFSQGYYATTYTRHLSKLKEVDVIACCDLGKSTDYIKECAGISAKDFTKEIGCKLVHSPEDMFKLGIDAVMIFTEVSDHKAYIEMALKNNCHVFVGKPLSFNPDDVRSVIYKADLYDRIVIPGNPLRYEGTVVQIANRVRNGEVGDPINIRILINHEAMIHPKWERDPKQSGGPLGTFGIYLIDTLRWITGQEINDLYAIGGQFVFPQINSWDNIQALGTTTEGSLVQLNLVSSITEEYPFFMLDVIGTHGTIRTNQNNFSYLIQGSDTKLGPIKYDSMGQMEIEHFIDCCLGRDTPKITLQDMLEAAKGIEAIKRSILTGEKVSPKSL